MNSRYNKALKALAKQQLLLGKVLDNKYKRVYGSNWKADFKAIKDQCSKEGSSVVSDKTANPESKVDDSDIDGADDDDCISDSEGTEKVAAKDFIDSIFTAARPWSLNDKW